MKAGLEATVPRTLIFDLGGVIVPLDFPRAFAKLGELCSLSAEEVPRRIRKTGLVPLLETGRVAADEFHRRISQELHLSVSFNEFRELWGTVFPPETLIPESLMESLHRRYRLLLLSNTNAIHFPFIEERYSILRHFDEFVLSYVVGAMKPDSAIYRAAISQAEAEPGECVFTDDVEENVVGALQEGIDAFQFESAEQLVRELRKRGVEI